MPTDRELIRLHLDMYLMEIEAEHGAYVRSLENWHTILAYCLGYYGEISMDILSVVYEMQREGTIL